MRLDTAAEEVCTALESAEGWMVPEELRFLFLAAALPTAEGEVVEIGSFKGKSTVALAKGALWCGQSRVVACDPFPPALAKWSPGGDLYEDCQAALQRYGVSQHVELHRQRSMDMLKDWDRPIRLLWVDGDHRYEAVAADVRGFTAHLAPGAIVALHDVNVGAYPGPQVCFAEDVLLCDAFGMCGLSHAIGWAQFVGEGGSAKHQQEKATLYQLLAARRLRHVFHRRMPRLARWRYKRLRKGGEFERWIRTACPRKTLWDASAGPWPAG